MTSLARTEAALAFAERHHCHCLKMAAMRSIMTWHNAMAYKMTVILQIYVYIPYLSTGRNVIMLKTVCRKLYRMFL